MMDTKSDQGRVELNELLAALPACRRCRANKRRCDTLLPMCSNCSKAGVECIFYDHVLKQDLPRSYITTLVDHLHRSRTLDGAAQTSTVVPSGNTVSLDTSDVNSDSSRYQGPLSCLSQSYAITGGPQCHDASRLSLSRPVNALEYETHMGLEMHSYLLGIYLAEIHPLYPFLDLSLPILSPVRDPASEKTPTEIFILEMVYSIACHVSCRGSERLRSLADACHRRAMTHIDRAMANITYTTLQAVSLMVMHSLFDPLKGNFVQLIGFAARLVLDIGGYESPNSEQNMRNVYGAIYCMENMFKTVLDRPEFLPEPSWQTEFDVSRPADALCALYRAQSHHRRHVTSRRYNLPVLDMAALEKEVSIQRLSPSLLSTAYETSLLLDPNADTALALLKSYQHEKSSYSFLTPHWIYWAGVLLLTPQKSSPLHVANLIDGYSIAILILDRLSNHFEGAAIMGQLLRNYMRQKNGDLECHVVAATPMSI